MRAIQEARHLATLALPSLVASASLVFCQLDVSRMVINF
jgi:hypothetical protein